MLRLVLAGTLPLAPDEAYYWLWSQHLQTGYFDHPPMVALVHSHRHGAVRRRPVRHSSARPARRRRRIGVALARRRGFLPAPPCRADRRGPLQRHALLPASARILITPDTPLMLFWTAALGRASAAAHDRRRCALVARGIGFAAGLALLSKYTRCTAGRGYRIVAGSPRRAGRASLRTPWPWARTGSGAAHLCAEYCLERRAWLGRAISSRAAG